MPLRKADRLLPVTSMPAWLQSGDCCRAALPWSRCTPQRGIALHHLSYCSPTAMLANRARHPTLTIHPCVGPSPHYYTMRGSRLFSPITLPNTSSNRHHNSISSLSSIKACSSTLHRSINLACFSIGGSDIYPCPLPFLELSAQA
jgi:hypothetical protein